MLLHGQPGSRADWRRVVPLLEGDHTLVVPDRPGYGDTGGRALGFRENASAAVRLLDDLDVETAVFVGYSWSGGVALSAAVHHPDRVSGMVLVASVRPGEEPGWADRMMAVPMVGEITGALTFGTTSRVLRMRRVQDLADRRLPRTARDAVKAMAGASKALSGAHVWQSFATEQRYLLSELAGLGSDLHRIEVPTVVVNGGSDRVVPAAVGARLAMAIPGAEFRVVPKAHHLLPFDRPEEIASAVRAVSAHPD